MVVHPLDDQILAVLRDAEELPLSAVEITERVGTYPAYLVLRRLWILDATRVQHQRIAGWNPLYWTATPVQLTLP